MGCTLCFNYSVEYRAGSENHRANCLPLPLDSDAELDTEPECVALVSSGPIAIPQDEFAAASARCPELSALRSQIAYGWPPSPAALDPVLRLYNKLRHEFSVQADFIFRGSRLVVPGELRESLVGT